MPTVLRLDGYRLYFYSDEGNEPPHIHIAIGDSVAKYWLIPVELAKSKGLRDHQLNDIRLLVIEHRDRLLEAWYDHFSA